MSFALFSEKSADFSGRKKRKETIFALGRQAPRRKDRSSDGRSSSCGMDMEGAALQASCKFVDGPSIEKLNSSQSQSRVEVTSAKIRVVLTFAKAFSNY